MKISLQQVLCDPYYCYTTLSHLRAFDVIVEIVSERVNEVDGLITRGRILEVTGKQD